MQKLRLVIVNERKKHQQSRRDWIENQVSRLSKPIDHLHLKRNKEDLQTAKTILPCHKSISEAEDWRLRRWNEHKAHELDTHSDHWNRSTLGVWRFQWETKSTTVNLSRNTDSHWDSPPPEQVVMSSQFQGCMNREHHLLELLWTPFQKGISCKGLSTRLLRSPTPILINMFQVPCQARICSFVLLLPRVIGSFASLGRLSRPGSLSPTWFAPARPTWDSSCDPWCETASRSKLSNPRTGSAGRKCLSGTAWSPKQVSSVCAQSTWNLELRL